MTEQLSGKHYPTLSMVIPLRRGQFAINMTTISCVVKITLIDLIQRILGVFEADKHASFACLLDLRFKKLAFGVDSYADKAQELIPSAMSNNNNHTLTVVHQTQDSQADAKTLPKPIWDQFDYTITL